MKFLLAILFTCASLNSVAQTNFVKNGDFERYDTCPYKNDQIGVVKYWTSVDSTYNISAHGNCSPEYFNSCASGIIYNMPLSFGGYQYAHSGNGMVGGCMFSDESPPPPAPEYYYRDYPQGRLHKTLTAGKKYCLKFYVNITSYSPYSNNKIGAFLDDGSIDTVSICSKPITHVRPQVFTNDVIDDTLNWVKIEGSFTANGTERFITLGNFFPLDSVIFNYIPSGIGQNSYYLIDDVSVISIDLPADAGKDTWVEVGKKVQIGRVGDTTAQGLDCKWYKKSVLIDSGAVISVNASSIKYAVDTYIVVQNVCGNITRDTMLLRTVGLGMTAPLSLGEGLGVRFRVHPNPSTGNFTITQLPSNGGAGGGLKVYDLLGRLVHQEPLNFSNIEAILKLNIPSGSYILELKDEAGNVQRERLVIQ